MGKRGRAAALLAALLAVGACGKQAPVPAAPAVADKAFLADEQRWREQRKQELQAADGWTSLVGLHWLELKEHYIGSGPGSGIRLAVGPARMALVSRVGAQVFLTPEPAAALSLDGKPLLRRTRLYSDHDATPSVIEFDGGKGKLSLIERGGRYALRVKHADAPTRIGFAGLHYWPMAESWRIRGRFVPNAPGKTLPIVDIIGVTTESPNAGALEFERDGKRFRLEAIGEPGRPLFVVFADRTSGRGSYPAGRFLDVPAPNADGSVVLDFNRAYNPPCAFTPFATCPLPPPENRLDLAVEAGEQAYAAAH
ncbi:DUF1684 domain-containing protein [Xanthomonas sp. CFBP 8703]|jgi:uncharacterized protein (DUF1684 family)|uniref:DUF1684 domain-containing protein n=1 Tax=Xanthomonas bonasiae TaxID=2810351 RepID=A0ABS3AXS0_9XANT|nr:MULTISPECIES: DUF1684 domain-containing protein [Xanthomonas]MBD7920439.1 DUF1684 domain-containing protein [Xanthomonas surreyensis]MBN6101158.1 DUF1684 domain-containing protein [Xanthomonas bonasiae]